MSMVQQSSKVTNLPPLQIWDVYIKAIICAPEFCRHTTKLAFGKCCCHLVKLSSFPIVETSFMCKYMSTEFWRANMASIYTSQICKGGKFVTLELCCTMLIYAAPSVVTLPPHIGTSDCLLPSVGSTQILSYFGRLDHVSYNRTCHIVHL